MPLAVAANDNGAGPQLVWVHANHMGVPAVYTNATGAQIAPPAGYSAPGFPGQSRTLGDLYYNRYRDYDPTTGRYIQADPIGLAGGASPYSYAMNNPLRYSDPLGLEILNLFPRNEPGLQEAAEEAYRNLPRPVQEGGLHIYGHGGPDTQCDEVRRNCDRSEEFADKLLTNKKYKYRVGQKIYLYSCLTGSTPNGFAQELSDFLQVDVEAPTKYTWYFPYGGLLGVAGKGPGGIGNPFSPSRMRRFTPR
jgi:RHS repeat-associated protein